MWINIIFKYIYMYIYTRAYSGLNSRARDIRIIIIRVLLGIKLEWEFRGMSFQTRLVVTDTYIPVV